MRVNILVSKRHGQGCADFFGTFRHLMRNARTWKIESASPQGVTIESTATLSSLPCKPRWRFTEHANGIAVVQCLNSELAPTQQAHALGDLVYLCLTALGRHVAKIEIFP